MGGTIFAFSSMEASPVSTGRDVLASKAPPMVLEEAR